MKTLRYLFIVVAILSVMGISAQESDQDWGKQPEPRMHSTSAMAGSGSTLPFAAVDGVTTTCVSPAKAPAGPRRIGGGNSGGGDDGPTTPEDVWSTPLGDALWSLALLALVFVVGKWTAKKPNHSANIN